jgi:hypothetical protein
MLGVDIFNRTLMTQIKQIYADPESAIICPNLRHLRSIPIEHYRQITVYR